MKKSWIKYIGIAIIVVPVLIACSSSGEAENTNSQGEVEVEFFSQKPEITPQLEELAQTYSEQNEGVNINITTVGSGEGAASLQAKFSSGDEPAIMMLGGLTELDRYSDTLEDVSNLEVSDTILEDIKDGGMINGELLGVPMSIEGFGWMYNKEIFQQAGINPDDIQSYDDFVTAVESLDSQKEELGIEEVFAFSGGEDYIVNQFSVNFASPEYNHDILESYESNELNWEYGDQMKKYTDLINEYNVQPILTMDYSRSVEELFVNDQVAMVHQGNWIVPTLNGLDPEFVEEKLGILPVFGESDTEGRIVAGAPWYLSVNSNMSDEVVQASKDFINWMYLSEEGQTALVEEFNFIPPQAGYDIESISDPVSQDIYQSLLNGETAAMTHKTYPDGWFQLVLYPEFQRYLDGESSWEEFEENTSQQYEDMSF